MVEDGFVDIDEESEFGWLVDLREVALNAT